MATERQVQELVARCVSIAVFYHNGEKAAKAKEMMAAEIRAVARQVGEMGLGPERLDEQFLRPVEAELSARYGPQAGARLYAAIARAFAGPASCLNVSRYV